MRKLTKFIRDRRGAVAIVVALSLPMIAGFAALGIDMGYIVLLQARLQATADAAGLAAASAAQDNVYYSTGVAVEYASKNMTVEGHGYVLDPTDVVLGNWNAGTHTFTPAGAGTCVNAVQVTTRRSAANGNPAGLFFGRILGFYNTDISARAVVTFGAACGGGGGGATRFLIDDEMIDSDVPVIEDLAAWAGLPPDELINDNDGDWFIDLFQHMPPGDTTIEPPTGQVGDEALFDIDHPAWPFSDTSTPSFADFLNFNEDGSWRQDLVPKSMLDPLVGVSSISDGSVYPSFVDPDFVHVSPVFKSDVSNLNPVGGTEPGTPAVNALGLRRGLLAFKIIGVGIDPDGAGSVLPNLIIEVVDPSTIDLNTMQPSASGGGGGGAVVAGAVQLVQ